MVAQDATFLPPKKFLFQNQFVTILLIPTMGILSSLTWVQRGLSNHKMQREAQEVLDILPCLSLKSTTNRHRLSMLVEEKGDGQLYKTPVLLL